MTGDITGTWEETFQAAEQEAIESGATIYTVKQESGDTAFFSLILTPKARQWANPPAWMGYFDNQEEAILKTKVEYGQDIVYVSPETMKRVVLECKEAQKGKSNE